ncbi:cytochrome P450 [Sphaerosporella brunnea]|uniref:Cytochrome P450 n=1 Tax=Sphaerosporella brunnea TaxID=1250544 RepID=A0A5J5F1P4_9PEZI|nr:cytochrome P450 [Sphaerosporella brunnea]
MEKIATSILHSIPSGLSLLSSFLLYRVLLVVYRLYFHPLSRIPGPKLAAATTLYVAYYDVYKNGTFLRDALPALHKKYGPVVRISPTEVQIHQPELYHRVNAMHSPFIKDPVYYGSIGVSSSAFGTTDQSLHRSRRSLINPMFSKRRILEASTIMQDVVMKLCTILETFCDSNKPVPLSNAFYCVTVDTITAYTFGESWNMLDEPNFTSEWVESVLSFAGMVQAKIQFPRALGVLEALGKVFPSLTPLAFIKLIQYCENRVQQALEDDAAAKAAGIPPKERPDTIYDALLYPPSEKAQRPSYEELVGESISMVTAGTDTSATVLQFLAWHFLTRPEVQEKLLQELATVEAEPNGLLPLKRLEELPYLTGFIKETLRYNTPAPGRQNRIVPEGGLTIPSTGAFLPAGTRIAFCVGMLHHDPRIFEDPAEFRPERWMGQKGKELDKWMLAFSKGDRVCVGINLAYAELHLVVANLFSRFKLELFETTKEDLECVDHFVGHLKGRIKVIASRREREAMMV